MKRDLSRCLAICCAIASSGLILAQTPAANPHPAGKIAARPLYRDPVFDNPTDPVIVFNAESKRWLMYYTQRRGASIAEIHGSKIGIAASEDNGATWKYIGTADITYGQDEHPADYTYWAPDVIWVKDSYHMFLAYVPGIFSNWNHPREIVHLTSKDGLKWDTIGKVDLKSGKVIDPCLIQIPNGDWRMFYKDEARPHTLCYADSHDLNQWEVKGNAVTNRNGEGPVCIRFQGKYWLLADTDMPDGQIARTGNRRTARSTAATATLLSAAAGHGGSTSAASASAMSIGPSSPALDRHPQPPTLPRPHPPSADVAAARASPSMSSRLKSLMAN
jgi:hypothetical protein